MKKEKSTRDRLGNIVKEGDAIRLLSLNWNGIRELPEREQHELKTMIREVHKVREIDSHGNIWITKVWDHGGNETESHCLALAPEEFEKVGKAS
jgi:hypothetical protein